MEAMQCIEEKKNKQVASTVLTMYIEYQMKMYVVPYKIWKKIAFKITFKPFVKINSIPWGIPGLI